LGKRERRKILVNPALSEPESFRMWMRREVEGGWLRQKKYHYVLDLKDLAKTIGDFDGHVIDMIIAQAAAWRSVSNTVAVAKDGMLQALGDGQQDRMACAQLCFVRAERVRHDTRGSSLASDGFFPYAKRKSEDAPFEAPELLVQAGCKAVVVPYDGKNVAEVEEYFRQAGVAVAFVKPEHRGFFGH
jgi:phosphoribosylaminoimidazolecarboxamide formyltransferase/IMP cyclohydrolase